MTALRTVLLGLAAGTIGTLAMDAVWYRRYRRGGGRSAFHAWDVTREVESWDQAPAPAQMGRKLVEAVTGRELPLARAAATTNLMHWAYGAAWTAGYALLTAARGRRWWSGPAFGAAVWASDYVTLPLGDVYEPIWRYDVATLWQDLNAHLVFGAAADAALRALSPAA